MQTAMVRGITAQLDFCLSVGTIPLLIAVYERSEMSVRSFCANIGQEPFDLYEESDPGNSRIVKSYSSDKSNMMFHNYISKIPNGRECIYHGACISPLLNDKYIITSGEKVEEDIFAYLMNNYTLPLLKEWISYIISVTSGQEIALKKTTLYGSGTDFENVCVYEMNMTEERMREIISQGLSSGEICISQNKQEKLAFENMDDYFHKYGHTLVENLEKKLNPLMPLKDKIDELVFLKRRFFPQQAAIVNGLDACLNVSSYAFLNEDMGCGKTLQSMGTVDQLFNHWYLNKNPDKTLQDVYMDPDSVKYRTIIMCPSHLVKKWAAAIKEDVPYAKVVIIKGLKELIKLKKKGKKRVGREYYIMSKDSGKLSYNYKPLPYSVKKKEVKLYKCKKCKASRPADLSQKCNCGSNEWKLEAAGYMDVGCTCNVCDELLYPADVKKLNLKRTSGERDRPLERLDFVSQTAANRTCRLCGNPLWVPSCSNIDDRFHFGDEHKKQKPKWFKMTHYANKAKKAKKTVWVARGDKDQYIIMNKLDEDEVSYPNVDGPRRFAPSRYVKKYLKDFFDIAIFDEAHERAS